MASIGFLDIPVRDESGRAIPSLYRREVQDGRVWQVVKLSGNNPPIPVGTVVKFGENQYRTTLAGDTVYGTNLNAISRLHREASRARLASIAVLPMQPLSEREDAAVSYDAAAQAEAETLYRAAKREEKRRETGESLVFDTILASVLSRSGKVSAAQLREEAEAEAAALTAADGIALNAD